MPKPDDQTVDHGQVTDDPKPEETTVEETPEPVKIPDDLTAEDVAAGDIPDDLRGPPPPDLGEEDEEEETPTPEVEPEKGERPGAADESPKAVDGKEQPGEPEPPPETPEGKTYTLKRYGQEHTVNEEEYHSLAQQGFHNWETLKPHREIVTALTKRPELQDATRDLFNAILSGDAEAAQRVKGRIEALTPPPAEPEEDTRDEDEILIDERSRKVAQEELKRLGLVPAEGEGAQVTPPEAQEKVQRAKTYLGALEAVDPMFGFVHKQLLHEVAEGRFSPEQVQMLNDIDHLDETTGRPMFETVYKRARQYIIDNPDEFPDAKFKKATTGAQPPPAAPEKKAPKTPPAGSPSFRMEPGGTTDEVGTVKDWDKDPVAFNRELQKMGLS